MKKSYSNVTGPYSFEHAYGGSKTSVKGPWRVKGPGIDDLMFEYRELAASVAHALNQATDKELDLVFKNKRKDQKRGVTTPFTQDHKDRFKKFVKELTKISRKYGVTIRSVEGILKQYWSTKISSLSMLNRKGGFTNMTTLRALKYIETFLENDDNDEYYFSIAHGQPKTWFAHLKSTNNTRVNFGGTGLSISAALSKLVKQMNKHGF